jgi:sec-independent protein translocase protein TatA
MIGPLEFVIILLIVVLLLGSGKLPGLLGDLGKGIASFKRGLKDKDPPTS